MCSHGTNTSRSRRWERVKSPCLVDSGTGDRPGNRREGEHDHGGQDQVRRPPRPVQCQRGTDDEAERDTGKSRGAVDGGEGGRTVLAVVIADQCGHDHHQQCPAHARRAPCRPGSRATQGRGRTCVMPQVIATADTNSDCRRPSRSTMRTPQMPAASEANPKRRAVQRGDDAGEVELLAQLTEHDSDAEPADQQGVPERRGVGEPIPPELVGDDGGSRSPLSFVPVKRRHRRWRNPGNIGP